MATKRDSLVSAIETRLKTILTTGGYTTNLGQQVHVWRTAPLPATTTLAVNVKDIGAVRNDESQVIGEFGWLLKVEISIFAQAAGLTASNLRAMYADVLKAIGTDDGFGGLADWTGQPEDDDMQLEQAEEISGLIRFTLPVQYSCPRWEL